MIKYAILVRVYEVYTRQILLSSWRNSLKNIPEEHSNPLFTDLYAHKPRMSHSGWKRFRSTEFNTFEEASEFIKTCETHRENQNGIWRMEHKIIAIEHKPDPDGLSRIDRAYLNLVQKKLRAGVLDRDDVPFLQCK